MIERFLPQDLGYREWGTELLIASTPHYIGKILRMRAGTHGGLQYHRKKHESFYLVVGTAHVISENEEGGLKTETMEPGQTMQVPPGTVHQVCAVTDCVFYEVSTPHFDDRVRVESRFGLPQTGGLPTTPGPDGDSR